MAKFLSLFMMIAILAKKLDDAVSKAVAKLMMKSQHRWWALFINQDMGNLRKRQLPCRISRVTARKG